MAKVGLFDLGALARLVLDREGGTFLGLLNVHDGPRRWSLPRLDRGP